MIELQHPINFDATAFAAVAGYRPVSARSGYITNCPDTMTQSDMDAMAVDQAPLRIAALWQEADSLALSIADHNDRARYTLWLVDPATPQHARDMIGRVLVAMDLLWQQYFAAKAMIQAGQEPAPFSVPKGLPTFAAIADAATEEV